MSVTRFVAGMLSMAVTVLGAGSACAQSYPNKLIRIFTSQPGGAPDLVSRLIASALSNSWGQPVIVENRAAGPIPGLTVSKAPPDGYTLLIYGTPIWISPLIEKTPYDPIRDFSPVSMIARTVNILVVHPSLPVKSVNDLIALAKSKPGKLNYASVGTGGGGHLAAELFNTMAGIKTMRVPYKGSGTAISDQIAGRVDISYPGLAAALPHIKSGKFRALAVTSADPSILVPELPTISASGLTGYEAVQLAAMFGPAKMPAAIVNRLNQEVVQILKRADVREKLLASGSETVGSSPEQLGAIIKSEMVKWGKIIKDAGIKLE